MIACGFASFLSIFTNTRTNFLQGASLSGNPDTFAFLLINMTVMALYFLYEGFQSLQAMRRGTVNKTLVNLELGYIIATILLIAFELLRLFAFANNLPPYFVWGQGIVVGIYLCQGYLIWLYKFYHVDKLFLALSALLWGLFASLIALLPGQQIPHIAIIVAALISLTLYKLSSKVATKASGAKSRDNTCLAKARFESEGAFSKLLAVTIKPIIFISITGFVSGALRVLIEGSFPNSFRILVFFLTALMGMIIFLLSLYNDNRFNYNSSYLKVSIVVACSVFLLPFINRSLTPILLAIVDSLYFLSLILMWAMCIEVAKSNQWDLKFVSGIFIGLVHVIVTLGFILSSTIIAYEANEQHIYSSVALCSVFFILLVIVYMMLNSQDSQAVLYEINVSDEELNTPDKTSAIKENNKPTQKIIYATRDTEALREHNKLIDVYELTDREMDVLILALSGRNAQGIADTLYISQNTVKTHLKNIYKKLGIHSHKELLEFIDLLSEESK